MGVRDMTNQLVIFKTQRMSSNYLNVDSVLGQEAWINKAALYTER